MTDPAVLTTADIIRAATSIGRDAADGKLSPETLQAQAVTELHELVGTVIGEGDVAWRVQLAVCRQVLALGGVSADELAEWLAVERQRAGEPLPAPAPPVDLLPAQSPASVDESQPESTTGPDTTEPEPVAAESNSDPVPVVAMPPQPQTKRRSSGRYDPLASWPAGRQGFVG